MTSYRLRDLVRNPIQKAQVNGPGRIDLEDIESQRGRLLTSAADMEARVGEGVEFASGDVLFGKLRPYLRKSLLCERSGICSPELLVLRPISAFLDPRFLFTWFLAAHSPPGQTRRQEG